MPLIMSEGLFACCGFVDIDVECELILLWNEIEAD